MKCKYCGEKLSKAMRNCPKCGRYNKKILYIRNKKTIIAGAAVLAILAVIIGGIFTVTSASKGIETKVIDEKNGEYMIVNAPSDFILDVALDDVDKAENITINNIYGETADTHAEVKDEIVRIYAPEKGYEEGEVYTADINGTGVFLNKEFNGAKKVIFVVKKENTIEIEYKDSVEEVDEDHAEVNGNRITVDGEYRNGDIIVFDSDDDGIDETYKLNKVNLRNGQTTAGYTEPTSDEVYEKLDIFYYDNVDLKNAEIDETAVGDMLEESGIIELFTEEAYAAEDVGFTAEFDGNNAFKITIRDPDHKDRQLEIKFQVADNVLLKCNKKTVFLDNTLTISAGVELSIKGSRETNLEKSIKAAIGAYAEQKNQDKASGEYKGTLIKVPIPIAGPVGIYVDLGAAAEFTASAEFNAGVDTELKFTQGIIYDITGLKTKKKYADVTGNIEASMMAKGTLGAYAGLYIEAGAQAASVAEVGIRADAGPYFDGEGCFIVKDIPKSVKTNGYYKIDIGLKLSAKAVVDLPLIKEKSFKLGDSKKSLIQYSKYLELKDINIETEYNKTDEGINIGTLAAEYYDKISGKDVKSDIKKYTLYINGKNVAVKDGRIDEELSEGKYTFKVLWKYQGQKFETEENVNITELDPWSWFGTVDLTGKTYGEINEKYGPLKQSETGEGGLAYRTTALDYEVIFPIASHELVGPYDGENEGEAIPQNDMECTAVVGSLKSLFGLNEYYKLSSFEELLGIELDYFEAWDEYSSVFYFEDKPFLLVVLQEKDGYVGPDTWCKIIDKSKELY